MSNSTFRFTSVCKKVKNGYRYKNYRCFFIKPINIFLKKSRLISFLRPYKISMNLVYLENNKYTLGRKLVFIKLN
ncbi:hypothetical protein BpHYR1_045566 [Brachionus plicatilis]|uniref:Uncharacterized protein n=1 Tax=Brachionus plicatilis TaxID=10195 RepID=A0A3M7QMV8_BRAPC|nr:hypothetical protein BpHYR1_045566 [Brachionus plicatilis]